MIPAYPPRPTRGTREGTRRQVQQPSSWRPHRERQRWLGGGVFVDMMLSWGGG